MAMLIIMLSTMMVICSNSHGCELSFLLQSMVFADCCFKVEAQIPESSNPSSFNAWIPPPYPLPDCTWWIIWKEELPSFNEIAQELFFLRIKIGLCGKGNGIWYCLRCRCSYEEPDIGDDVPDSQDACDKSDAKCLWRVQVNWGYVAPSSSDKYHLVVIM